MNPRLLKIGRNILFLLSIPGIIGAFVFAHSNQQDDKLDSIHVDITNTQQSFVTVPDVMNALKEEGVIPNESIVTSIHTNELEKSIKENKWVKDAEIYITANHTMNVVVTQKVPVVRINQNDSVDYAYYLDEYANPIELSEQYIDEVPVVTSPELGYTMKDLEMKHDIVNLATYISSDTFWNAMVTQINIDSKGQFELIPAIGNHVIRIGNIDDLDNKMHRLLAFYQNGLNTIDWNKYNEIDVRFSHQIVARNTTIDAFPDVKLLEMKEQEKAEQKAKAAVTREAREQKEQAQKNKAQSHPIAKPKAEIKVKKNETKKVELKKTEAKKPSPKKPTPH